MGRRVVHGGFLGIFGAKRSLWRGKFRTIAWVCLGLALGPPAWGQETPARDPARPWAAAADRLAATGELEAAAEAYRGLTLSHASDAPLWLRLALVELQLGRGGSALEAARTASQLAPGNPDTYLVRAQAEAATGDPQFGRATLREGLTRFPQNLELLAALAQVSVELGQLGESMGLLRQLARLDPGNAMVRLDLIRLLITAEEYPAAEAEIRAAMVAGIDEALLLALQGKAQLLSGRPAAARATFERAVQLRPTAEALGGLGAIHFLNGESGRAVTTLRRAIELDPEDPDLYFNLGNALTHADRLDEAERAYRNSLRLDRRAATTHLNLGMILLRKLEVRTARSHLERAQTLDPSLTASYLHLGRIYAAAYEYDQAIRQYENYAEYTSDPNEETRIGGVVAGLRRRRAESVEARARGEIHLLQARLKSEDAARDVIRLVQAGGDFFSIAAERSEVAKAAGVDVGFLDPRELHGTFQSPVARLAVGEMTSPLAGPVGYFVFYRVE